VLWGGTRESREQEDGLKKNRWKRGLLEKKLRSRLAGAEEQGTCECEWVGDLRDSSGLS
jgi:hypothetical protein